MIDSICWRLNKKYKTSEDTVRGGEIICLDVIFQRQRQCKHTLIFIYFIIDYFLGPIL
jgi:hypothetical protein